MVVLQLSHDLLAVMVLQSSHDPQLSQDVMAVLKLSLDVLVVVVVLQLSRKSSVFCCKYWAGSATA